MREDMIKLLRCPVCKGEQLELHDRQHDGREVRSGVLKCQSCSREYPIIDGVAELLPELEKDTLQERQARDVKKRDWETERQRPYFNDSPDAPWVWPDFAANVEQGLSQVELEGKLVLDVGAATCWSTRMICERGAQAVALDVSTGMLLDGEAQFDTGLFFNRLAATMDNIPVVDETFDVVFASATIHHTGALEGTFNELSRVTKPGGCMILVNEPVLGLLKSGSDFGLEDARKGMNEHIYRLRNYLQAARSTGWKARILFPAGLEQQLRGEAPAPNTLLINAGRRIWRLLPKTLQKLGLYPGHWLIGLTLIMVARKDKESDREDQEVKQP